jgi:AcrR family transcriptional regulator
MDDVKNFILDRAQDRFDRFGFKKTTMDDISRDCRMSKKTIYEHFHDKENLFNSLFIREARRARDTIFARMDPDAAPLEKLQQLIRTAIAYFSEDNFLTSLLKDDEALFSAFLSAKYNSVIDEELIGIIAAIIRDGKARGQIRDIDEQVVAYAGLKLFQAFSYMRTMAFDKDKQAQGYYAEALVDFVTHGLTSAKD